jgi:hypothetical protein
MHSRVLPDSAISCMKHMLAHPAPSDTYVFIFHCTHAKTHFGCYVITHDKCTIHKGCQRGIDQMQALC